MDYSLQSALITLVTEITKLVKVYKDKLEYGPD